MNSSEKGAEKQYINGQRIYDFAAQIFPYFRSITGEGVRQTLNAIEEYITFSGESSSDNYPVKMTVTEVPTGSEAFDWTVPKEWVIREAYIEDEDGNHIIDAKEHNLHVLGYSTPVDEWVSLEELKEHVYTEPSQPEVIPYVTSYYKERFGFCMSQNRLDSLREGKYHMYVDSELIDGSLTIGEVVIPGRTDKEVFFSTYFCHPSMGNNECSGLALQSELIRYVARMPHREYTYRFVFIPETIGSITYLSRPGKLEELKDKVVSGFVLSCVGDDNDYSIVESRYANTLADKVLKNVLMHKTAGNFSDYPYSKRGSDERQYNAPGVNLPVVCFCRSKFGEFPEYHTSADDMTYISPEGFEGSYEVMTKVIEALENNATYQVTVLCEPQLGKRGLYSTISRKGTYDFVMIQRDVIAYSDGQNDVIDLSNRIGIPVSDILDVIKPLAENGLLKAIDR